ncbi:MAG: ATP-binding protein [Bacilli bacterium]|nr:ATP-binding protein [Bacilli bacterium]
MLKSYERLKKREKEKYKVPKSAQDIINVDVIYKDGIFKLGNKFSKTYRFSDINYAIASKEEKEGMFLNYSELLNSLDSSTITKITINNRKVDLSLFKENILIQEHYDERDELSKEYNDMLLDNIEKSNGIEQEKYITVSVFKDSVKDARTYFNRVTNELSSHFSKLGSKLEELSLNERLKILYDFYRSDSKDEFNFDLNEAMRLGNHFKDSICPYKPQFHHQYFQLGDKFGCVMFLSNYATYIKDSFVSELCDLDKHLMFSMDIISIQTDEAVKEVENRLLGVETNITNWQRRQNANNNFSAVIPYDMEAQRKEAKEFLDDLTIRDQRMMLGNITLVHLADSKKELDADSESLMAIARKYMCELQPFMFSQRQLDGLRNVLPNGTRDIKNSRTLLTESTAVFIPFRAQEVMDKGGIWFGQNAITNNMIICNKENLLNPNAFILGVPGSGKSFLTKEQIAVIALATNDTILIADPEAEYTPLVQHLGGQVIKIAAGSTDHINAMDMNEGYGDSKNPLSDKSEFIMSLFEQLDKSGVDSVEHSIIDRCVREVYEEAKSINKTPTLVTLRKKLLEQKEAEARKLALKLELFTEGSLNIFAHETNVNINNRIISYDIQSLGKQLKTMGLLVITDAIINKVNQNWLQGKRTHIFIDEFHIVFENEYSASFFNSAWRQFRKRDGFPTGITQNVEYLLDSVQASTMLSNSEFIVMLNQAYQDRTRLAELLNISDEQLSYITNAQAGCGLIRYGHSLVPFINHFPTDTKLYKLMTTKPSDRKKRGQLNG